MKSYKRSTRVADQIRRDVAEIVSDLLRDETHLIVTISTVELTDDLRYAKIFYTVLGGEEEKKEAAEIFKDTLKQIQTELAHRLTIRRVPEISMHYDTSLLEGLRVTELIDKVMAETPKNDEQNDG